jgi:hypothetical protein
MASPSLHFLEQSILRFTHSRNDPPAPISITTDQQWIEENDDHSPKVRARDSAHRLGVGDRAHDRAGA